MLFRPALDAHDPYSPLGIERLAHVPRYPFSFREYHSVFLDGVGRIFRQFVLQLGQTPFYPLYLATQGRVQDVGQLCVGVSPAVYTMLFTIGGSAK